MIYDEDYKFVFTEKKKIIMVPYPAQGHVTPMLKLASILSTYGFQPLIILPEFIHRSISPKVRTATKGDIVCLSIPDGLNDETKPRDFFAIELAMENCMPGHLDRLIRKINGDGDGNGVIACMIVDVIASWAINVGKECGIVVSGFWPAMLATYSLGSSIDDMVGNGVISDSGIPQLQGHIPYVHPPLRIEHLPWLIGTQADKIARFKFWTRTMDRSKSLRCILVNSFPNEIQTITNPDTLGSNPSFGPNIYPIGPLRNGLFESPTFWEKDLSCLGWLDQQKPNSVLYISFGSWVSPIKEANIRILALSLEELRRPFIWVLGPNWRNGLPIGYMDRIQKFGKIVTWAPQVDVLQHKGVGCYLTHCGWNSTLEAIECKKKLLCFPLAGDQFLNCEYIFRVWKIGVKLNGFCFADVRDGVSRVMEDLSMKKRLEDLKETTLGEEANSKAREKVVLFLNDVMRDHLLSCN